METFVTKILQRRSIFESRWFDLVSKQVESFNHEYYSLTLSDYVTILAMTDQKKIVCVEQYRPAVEQVTIELPSGHVDPGETPEEAIKREFSEETGLTLAHLELIGKLHSNTGRLENKLWCYFSNGVYSTKNSSSMYNDNELLVRYYSIEEFWELVLKGVINHALDLSVIAMSLIKNKIGS